MPAHSAVEPASNLGHHPFRRPFQPSTTAGSGGGGGICPQLVCKTGHPLCHRHGKRGRAGRPDRSWPGGDRTGAAVRLLGTHMPRPNRPPHRHCPPRPRQQRDATAPPDARQRSPWTGRYPAGAQEYRPTTAHRSAVGNPNLLDPPPHSLCGGRLQSGRPLHPEFHPTRDSAPVGTAQPQPEHPPVGKCLPIPAGGCLFGRAGANVVVRPAQDAEWSDFALCCADARTGSASTPCRAAAGAGVGTGTGALCRPPKGHPGAVSGEPPLWTVGAAFGRDCTAELRPIRAGAWRTPALCAGHPALTL